MPALRLLYPAFLLFLGCAQTNVTPGMTFVVGLNRYQLEMARLQGSPERWVDRQRLGESLKTTYLMTMGGSPEFNGLVDLDVRKREFLIVLGERSLKPERAKEIREELATMNKNIEDLKGLIKGQLTSVELRSQAEAQRIETVAAIGLIHLALDRFSANSGSTYPSAQLVKIGQYVVADHGNLASVRTPEGQTYRCSTIVVPEQGAAIQCEPVGGK
jgi:hypothetical protein